MHRLAIVGLIVATLNAGARAQEPTASCPAGTQGKSKCGQACKLMRDAAIEVTNTKDGVIVKITSKDAEAVKKIQACWAGKAAKMAAANAGETAKPKKCGSKSACGGCAGKKAAKTAKTGTWEPETIEVPKAHAPHGGHSHGGHSH